MENYPNKGSSSSDPYNAQQRTQYNPNYNYNNHVRSFVFKSGDESEPTAKISKLVRIIARAESKSSFDVAVQMIIAKLEVEDNRIYLQRSFHIISASLVDVFKSLACGISWFSAGKEELTRLILHLHKTLQFEGPCDKIPLWLCDLIAKKGKGKKGRSLNLVLMHDVFIDVLNIMSAQDMDRMPGHILRSIEKVDSSGSFKCLCTLFGHCVTTLKTCNSQYFADFVDVVIGWMVDEESKDDNSQFCQDFLLILRENFLKETDFAKTLITTIIDDIETISTDEKLSCASDKLELIVKRIVLLNKAYVTMLRSNCLDDKQFVNECTEKVMGHTLRVLNSVPCTNEMRQLLINLMCMSNEAIALSPGAEGQCIRTFIKTEIESLCTYQKWKEWNFHIFSKLWEGICTWIEGAVSITQLSEETIEIAHKLLEFLDKKDNDREKILLVQTLFRTRNVQLLQKIYQWHLGKFESKESSVLYLLAGLTDIAGNKSGSILSLYALTPSIFQLLIDLATKQEDAMIKRVILEVLKMHCSVHSHWVSSLSSTSKSEYSDSGESPGARFLPTLMDFWLSNLLALVGETEEKLWILDWIIEFLTCSPAYAAAIFNTSPSFFEQILTFVCYGVIKGPSTPCSSIVQSPITEDSEEEKVPVDSYLNCNKVPDEITQTFEEYENPKQWPYTQVVKQLMSLYCDHDGSYYKVGGLRELITKFCKRALFPLSAKVPWEIYPTLVKALNQMPTFFINEISLRAEQFESTLSWALKQERDPITLKDYSRFLTPSSFSNLIFRLISNEVINKTAESYFTATETEPPPSPLLIRAGVDFLMRAKLRTPLGKPQELFGQIQAAFRRKNVPPWKFQFMFLLEQSFLLWMGGTRTINLELPETTRAFFDTNKNPCTQWLRIIRADLYDVCMTSGWYYDAFYHSVMDEDLEKARLAVFNIRDAEGALGEDPTMQAAYYFVQGRFEKALALLKEKNGVERGPCEELMKDVYSRSVALLATDFTEMLPPNSPQKELNFLFTNKHNTDSFLDSQINFLIKQSNYSSSYCKYKKSLSFCQNEVNCWTLLKTCNSLRSLPSISLSDKRKAWIQLALSLVQEENLVTGQKLLEQLGIDFEELRSNGKVAPFPSELQDIIKSDKLLEQNATVLQIASHLLLEKGEVNSVIIIYNELLNLAQSQFDQEEENCTVWRRNLLLDVSKHLKDVPVKSLQIMNEIGPDIEKELCGSMPGSFGLLPDSTSLQLVLLKKALFLNSEDCEAWLAMGEALYDFPVDLVTSFDRAEECAKIKRAYKQKALASYCAYLRNCKTLSTGNSDSTDAPIMNVISRVIRLINEDETMLECCPTEIMLSKRWLDFLPHVAQTPSLRAPMLSSFPEKSSMYLWSYALDSNNGNLSTSPVQKKGVFNRSWLADANEECHSIENKTADSIVGKIDHRVATLAKELLRVGTTPEELWTSCLPKIIQEWQRRMASLRKEMAKDPDPLKIDFYMSPVFEYLQRLWKLTVDTAESPAQVSFLLRNTLTIPPLLEGLKTCTSLEALVDKFEKLLLYAEDFESYSSHRNPLGRMSPKLANFDKWGNGVTLLGIPDGVTIISIDPVVYSLFTKTRPKKINFLGSNGKYYEYLVKGNENLNVDAGMMEFLMVCRTFLKQPIWTYAITPLGTRGGLIKMVKNVKPVLQLYKRYLSCKFGGERVSTSELFWRQMNAHGLENRESAESQTLKIVYNNLKADSPKDLISREFLLSSADARTWFKKVKGFTRDSAISCAIGYLLGIGDRHLDNILVDINEGKLIHVDFSLVFGRGEKLKVPELVPFRLTQNFSNALQYPGINGPFMTYMKDFLWMFQNNSELASFCAESIAFASQIEEDFSIVISQPSSDHTGKHPQEAVILLMNKFRDKMNKLDVENESVDNLVHEAENETNLCKMFEGWTPWI